MNSINSIRKLAYFETVYPTPTPPPWHVSQPAWKVQRLLWSCSLHVKKKREWWNYSLTFPLCMKPKSNEKIIYTLWQHFTIRINDERTNPSRTLDRPLLGTTVAQQLHQLLTSIAGSFSKPIASIFLSEEHFLSLEKEIRNLYSFSPLKC